MDEFSMQGVFLYATLIFSEVLNIQTECHDLTYCVRKDTIGKKMRLNDAFRMRREFSELREIKGKIKENNELNGSIKRCRVDLKRVEKLISNKMMLFSKIEGEERKRSNLYVSGRQVILMKRIQRMKDEVSKLEKQKRNILVEMKRLVSLKIKNTEKIIFLSNYFVRNENFISKLSCQDMSFIETLRNKQKEFQCERESDCRTLTVLSRELEYQNIFISDDIPQVKKPETIGISFDEIQNKDIFTPGIKNSDVSSGIEEGLEISNSTSEQDNISSYHETEIQFTCSTPQVNKKDVEDMKSRKNRISFKLSPVYNIKQPKHTETVSDDLSYPIYLT